MLNFNCYSATCRGNNNNCLYPNKVVVSDKDSFVKAVIFDHVTVQLERSYRGKNNFISSNCIPMDCDNDHSDDEKDWVTPLDVALAFPDVCFYASYSRNHMKLKGTKSARPRFHIFFPIEEIKDVSQYNVLKKRIQEKYPYFDDNAIDVCRLLYGVANPQVELYEGERTVVDFILEDDFIDFDEELNKIQEGSRNTTMSHFAGKILKRYGISEESKKAFLEESKKCNPPLEKEELQLIWKSAIRFYENISKQKGYIPPEEYKNTSWDIPLPLIDEKMPDFPIEALPKALRNYAIAVGKSTQTPVDMAAVGVLTTISACMKNLYKVEGKADWHEPTNIYSVIIAEPSERKSAVISLVIKPVDEYVKKYNQIHKLEFEMSKIKKQKLENKKNSLINQSKKKGEEKSANDFNDELRNVVKELVDFKESKPLKVYIDDTTTEKLTESLAENNNAISIISSEGGIFDVISGAYASKVNIDVFLKAYSGENISVDRIMRNSIYVEKACLSILLSVQPVVIGELMRNKKFRHRGLTARFLYTTPQSFVGNRMLDSQCITNKAYEEYKAVIDNILMEEKSSNPYIIKLNEKAKILLKEYYDWVERALIGELTVYSDWLGKLVGNTLRIAGILARSSVIRNDVGASLFEDEASIVIDEVILSNAIKLGKYFLAHAVNAYGTMGIRSGIKAAIMVLEKLKEKELKKITRREVMRNCRWVRTAEEAQSILDTLEEYGYIRILEIPVIEKMRGGRPKNMIYAINPNILSD